jgi:hypothetical protein
VARREAEAMITRSSAAEVEEAERAMVAVVAACVRGGGFTYLVRLRVGRADYISGTHVTRSFSGNPKGIEPFDSVIRSHELFHEWDGSTAVRLV